MLVKGGPGVQLSSCFESIFSKFLSGLRPTLSCQTILLKMIEDWKQSFDNGKMVGTIAVDLRKDFDSLPHGLLIAKLAAYGVDFYSCRLLASYLYNRHQRVKLGDIRSARSAVTKGVPLGSILGPILFDVLINDIFFLDCDCHVYNYADDHRPHARQLTGARCTGGRGSPVMIWILLKANNAQQASGVGDKIFFRFKRNVQHLWTAILRHHVNDITHQHVMRFNQWSKFANVFKVHLKNPPCFGTLAQPFHFLPNTPIMTQWILTGPARVEWLWVNDFSHSEYHIWQAWPSTYLLTCGEQVTKIWSTSLHCADA